MAPDLDVIRDLIRGFARCGLGPVEICCSVSRYLSRQRTIKLPLKARLYLALRGFCPIVTVKGDGWGPLPFFLVKCPKHGIVLDYPHGYAGKLNCPLCER